VPLCHGKPRSKEAIYCWYSRDGDRKAASQHARDARFKLSSNSSFFDVIADPDEKENLAGTALSDALREPFSRLKSILDKHLAVTLEADPTMERRRAILDRNP